MVNQILPTGGTATDYAYLPPASYQQSQQLAPAQLRNLYQQQKYDPRMTGLTPLVKGLSRGFIAQDLAGQAIDSLGLRRFSFLFNPSEIDVSYASTGDLVAPGAPGTSPGSQLAAVGATGGTQVSLSLLVDRTYETWSNKQSRGVMEDIHQLEKMCYYSELNPFLYQSQFCHIFLGPVQHWFGSISSMDVTYTSWTQFLVPNRAAISLGFQVYTWDGSYHAQQVPVPIPDTSTLAQDSNLGPNSTTFREQVPQDTAKVSQTASTANPTGRVTPTPYPTPTPP